MISKTLLNLSRSEELNKEYAIKKQQLNDLLRKAAKAAVQEKSIVTNKVITKFDLKKSIKNKKVVFVNGCFDVLHRGHYELFEYAKKKGEILVVGLNSDDSIRRLKGPNRPIFSFDDRAFALSKNENIDYICKFEEDTPIELIKFINPFLHVKGSDHEGEKDIPNTIFFKRLEDFSTTKTKNLLDFSNK